MYIARDSDGDLYFYIKKPLKREDLGVWISEGKDAYITKIPTNVILPKSINPMWEDSEPIKVKLIRDNKEG